MPEEDHEERAPSMRREDMASRHMRCMKNLGQKMVHPYRMAPEHILTGM